MLWLCVYFSGGRTIMVMGSGFDLVQEASIRVVASPGEWSRQTVPEEVRARNTNLDLQRLSRENITCCLFFVSSVPLAVGFLSCMTRSASDWNDESCSDPKHLTRRRLNEHLSNENLMNASFHVPYLRRSFCQAVSLLPSLLLHLSIYQIFRPHF